MKLLTHWKKRLVIMVGFALVLVIGLIGLADYRINHTTADRLYTDVNKIPHNKVGLLLGTNKYIGTDRLNLFYKYRITAAVELFQAGKIDYILVSGDNSRNNYNEPELMKTDLVERGVPEDRIYFDYAGFRTWDSIVRLKQVFQESSVTIISQRFHNQRATYLAMDQAIAAVAYNAQDVPLKVSPRVWLRERLARVQAVFIDALFEPAPKFLGEAIIIE